MDFGRVEGLTGSEKRELIELGRKTREWEMENEILKRASAYFARENPAKIAFRIVREQAAQGFPLAQVDGFGVSGVGVSRSGFYD